MPNAHTIVHLLTIIDGVSEELVGLTEIKQFELNKFCEQFDVDQSSDPEMRGRYSVGPDDLLFLQEALGHQLQVDFTRFAYFVEAAAKK